MQIVKILCLVAATWFFAELAWTIHAVRPKALVTIDNVDRTVIVTGAAAGDVEKAARKWQEASESQVAATSTVLSDVSVLVGRTTALLSRTDNSLNSLLTPQILSALNQQNAALLSNQERLQGNLTALQSATVSLNKTLTDADAQVSNPAISNSLSNLEASTLNLNAGVKNLTAVTADAKSAADYELQQLQKPEKVWMAFLKFVLQYGANARGLFTGF
jgi:hypothetical protein